MVSHIEWFSEFKPSLLYSVSPRLDGPKQWGEEEEEEEDGES